MTLTDNWEVLQDSGRYYLTEENCNEIKTALKVVKKLKEIRKLDYEDSAHVIDCLKHECNYGGHRYLYTLIDELLT